MLQPFGQVVSTRILRDYSGSSRGVGFARWVVGLVRLLGGATASSVTFSTSLTSEQHLFSDDFNRNNCFRPFCVDVSFFYESLIIWISTKDVNVIHDRTGGCRMSFNFRMNQRLFFFAKKAWQRYLRLRHKTANVTEDCRLWRRNHESLSFYPTGWTPQSSVTPSFPTSMESLSRYLLELWVG